MLTATMTAYRGRGRITEGYAFALLSESWQQWEQMPLK